MKLSLIISSFNQKNRLRHCLDSALKQKLLHGTDYEIILADYNSNDGTDDLLENYPTVKVIKSKFSKREKYTLATNWNSAVLEAATGDRVIFTNGDHIFSKRFVDWHADPAMKDDIIFGPALQTRKEIEPYIYDSNLNYKDLVKLCEKNEWLLPDRHSEGSAMTYNQEWEWWFPFGYNFSVLAKHFKDVGGFPIKEEWGGEERVLCKKIVDKFGVKVKSNCNSLNIHLWHPIVNHEGLYGGDKYRF